MEELIKLPVSFQKKYTSQCYCCETIKTVTVQYDLKIEIMEHSKTNDERYRSYRLYYQPTWYGQLKENPQVIGENTGMGTEDITKLVDKLLEEIKK